MIEAATIGTLWLPPEEAVFGEVVVPSTGKACPFLFFFDSFLPVSRTLRGLGHQDGLHPVCAFVGCLPPIAFITDDHNELL